MNWLAWRQIRPQLIVSIVGLIALAILLAITGHVLAHDYQSSVASCAKYDDCVAAKARYLTHLTFLQGFVGFAMICVPGLIGLFWGAPLFGREFENGTFRMVWTQGVTRSRWLLTKLAWSALSVVVVASALALMVTWWSTYFDRVNATPFTSFDKRGIVEVGYALFALSLGAFLGLVMRRSLPAMATTLVGFAAVRTLFTNYVRQHLLPVSHITTGDRLIASVVTNPTTGPKGDWVLSDSIINGSGKVIGTNGVVGNGNLSTSWNRHGLRIANVGSCPNLRRPKPFSGSIGRIEDAIQKCVSQLHIRDVLTYQPSHHYWPLQWLEFALYAVMSVVLAGLCLWWVRRRIV